MAMYPNQRTVKIDKKISGIYLIYGEEEMAYACSVLNGSGFKVWCYLLKNKDGVIWDISPADAKKRGGIKKTTFHDGIRELVEKGFIDFDEGIIYQRSQKRLRENRTPGKDNLYDIRTTSYADAVWDPYEKQQSNNITNNITLNNVDILNDNVENIVKPVDEEFIF